LNYFDLIIAIAFISTGFTGFKNGMLQSIFKTIGYIAGGVVGVAIAVEVMSKWSNTLAKAGGAIILILLLAIIGEFIFGKVGLGFRKTLLIAPLKFIDSLLGALLSITRIAFITYLLAVILVATPWSFGDKYIKPSKFYTYTDSHLPKVITDLKIQADKLFKELN
jgi:uncharacterized membrane protein required for colicin V production